MVPRAFELRYTLPVAVPNSTVLESCGETAIAVTELASSTCAAAVQEFAPSTVRHRFVVPPRNISPPLFASAPSAAINGKFVSVIPLVACAKFTPLSAERCSCRP